MKHRGFKVWEGASWIDGAPIVCIVTLKSVNRKTGDMAQVWILRSDIDPVQAINEGKDASICGACVHRGLDGFKQRSCYVDVAKAPLGIFKAAGRGVYPTIALSDLAAQMQGRKVRLGAYGDPAVLPVEVLDAFTRNAVLHTGYTHQWMDARAAHARRWCMASCDTPTEVAHATAGGWRVFYVGTESVKGKACPASDAEMKRTGKEASCASCGLCCGTHTTKGRDLMTSRMAQVITIIPHGSGVKSLARKMVALTIRTTA